MSLAADVQLFTNFKECSHGIISSDLPCIIRIGHLTLLIISMLLNLNY